jgi:hypothetical protein
MIVLQDTRGLSPSEAEEVCVWAASELLAAEAPRRAASTLPSEG